jgi:chemotaxis protein methyltransferase WspC
MEIGLNARRYQVHAIDVSMRRLEVARRGIFSSNAFRGSALSFRDRYFQSHPEGFEIDPSLRTRVRFLQGSILDPGLLSGEPVFDVLFCRNLLIYLDEPSRVRVMMVLDRLLAVEGLLIIGHADRLNLSAIDPAFTQAGDHRAFTYRKTTSPSSPGQVIVPSVQTLTWQAPQLPSPRPRKLLTWQPPQSPERVTTSQVPEDARTGPAYRSSQDLGSQSPSQLQPGSAVEASGSLLDRASELANLGRHDEAVALCEQVVRQEGPSAPAYYLMGVIHQSVGNRTRGEKCFQKAVYLDPGNDEALLALALSAERRGDVTAAAGFRRRAERAIFRKGVR